MNFEITVTDVNGQPVNDVSITWIDEEDRLNPWLEMTDDDGFVAYGCSAGWGSGGGLFVIDNSAYVPYKIIRFEKNGFETFDMPIKQRYNWTSYIGFNNRPDAIVLTCELTPTLKSTENK